MPNAFFFSALPARRGLLIVALCLAACAAAEEGKEEAEGKAEANEAEAEIPRNDRVLLQVRGNMRVTRETVMSMIQTKSGERFDRTKLEEDWQRLKDSGLFASVATMEPLTPPGTGRLVQIEVMEHPAVHEIKIEAKGVRKLPKDASPELGLKQDEMLVAGKVEAARATIANAYAKAGTPVRVEARTETRSTRRQFVNNQWETCPDTVDVVFTVRRAANPKADTAAADTMVSIPGATVLKEAEQGK